MAYAVIDTEIQKRFSDIDSFHHVNNVSQQMYFDLGKTDFFRAMISNAGVTGRLRTITARTETDYIGQVLYEDPVFVRTSVEKIGEKSIVLFQQLISRESGQVLTESRSVMVAFDFETQQSIAVPEEWRRNISIL